MSSKILKVHHVCQFQQKRLGMLRVNVKESKIKHILNEINILMEGGGLGRVIERTLLMILKVLKA